MALPSLLCALDMPSYHGRFHRPSGEYLVITQEGIVVLLVMRRSNALPRPLGFGMDYSPGLEQGCAVRWHQNSGRSASDESPAGS